MKIRNKILSVMLAFALILPTLMPVKDTGLIVKTEAAGSFTGSKFNGDQYTKALWMVTRYYGGQRMGVGPNWLTKDHVLSGGRADYNGGKSFLKDADGSYDLTGGWFDCGDHVLFGQTFFYSAYMLALAYREFPEGFHDLYNGKDYSDYSLSGDWSINGGQPNQIPDLLEELKYATDWIIKATPDTTTFYSQKGNGYDDHKEWVTAGYMSGNPKDTGGESNGARQITKNPNDGVMPAFAAGALAIMSDLYREYDSTYADLCLAHAKNAYAYAKSHKGQAVGAPGFYDPFKNGDSKSVNAMFALAASELFIATGESTYSGDIKVSELSPNYHVLDYSNANDLAYYAAAKALPNRKSEIFSTNKFMEECINKYTASNNLNGEGCQLLGGTWGQLRYNGNTAFSIALYSKLMGTTQYDEFIAKQIDYVLGANNAKQSFLIGFDENGAKMPKHPHHRNVFLNDGNVNDAAKQALPIPERNKYFGGIVGGNRNSGSYNDSITSYQDTEGGVDYNAGILGALGYIVSKVNPYEKGDPPDPPEPCPYCGKTTACDCCDICEGPCVDVPLVKPIYDMQTDDWLDDVKSSGIGGGKHPNETTLQGSGGERTVQMEAVPKTITILERGTSSGIDIKLPKLDTIEDHSYRFEVGGKLLIPKSGGVGVAPGAALRFMLYNANDLISNPLTTAGGIFDFEHNTTHSAIAAHIAGSNPIGNARYRIRTVSSTDDMILNKIKVVQTCPRHCTVCQSDVITPPSAPQNFTAAAGNAQVALSWSAPNHDGGAPVIGYQVSSDNGANWVTALSNTEHTFTGLTNGTTYTFKVRAVNSAGEGAEATATATPQAPVKNGYVKLKNTNIANKSICTRGLFLTDSDDPEELHKWQTPARIIRPNQFIEVYGMSPDPDTQQSDWKRGYANFTIADGGTVTLIDILSHTGVNAEVELIWD